MKVRAVQLLTSKLDRGFVDVAIIYQPIWAVAGQPRVSIDHSLVSRKECIYRILIGVLITANNIA